MSLKGDQSYFEGSVGTVDFTFQQPIDDKMRTKLSAFLEAHLPNSDIKILGKLCEKTQEMGALGHYRIQVGERDLVVCVGRVGDAQCVETLSIGNQAFNHYRDEGIAVVNSVPFSQVGAENPENDWIINAKIPLGTVGLGDKTLDCYVHLEECALDIIPLKDSGIEGCHAELGALIGAVYNAGESMPASLVSTLEQTTNSTTLHYVKEGMKVTKAHLTTAQPPKGQTATAFGEAQAVPKDLDPVISSEMQQCMLNWVAEFEENRRVPTAFNMIEKMIWKKPGGALALACCDTPSRGYLPMMTENASYDLGTVVHRIILSPNSYDVTDNTPINQKIQSGLEEFVQAYKAETGLSLTVDEALDAAQKSFAFSCLQIPGLYSLGEIEITSSLDEHIETTLTGIVNSVNKIKRHRPSSGMLENLVHDK